MPKTSNCLKVNKKQGQMALALSSKMGLFDKTLEIRHDEGNLCIPIVRKPKSLELERLLQEVPGMQFSTCEFTEKPVAQETLDHILKNKIPQDLLAKLPQALDVIGDIAILEIPPELQPFNKIIGEAILKIHKNIRTVLAKAGAINGIYRTREYVFIAGDNKTKTIHKEFGCQLYVDVAKAYFSPRLSHEHERVASLVQKEETIVDLFAGVGPFSILIAKRNPDSKVFAVDINPDAIELLKVNARVNRVENRVFPILADARKIAQSRLKGVADRVIMNLPETAIEFTDAACNSLKAQGGVVHFYAFVRYPKTIEDLKSDFSKAVQNAGRRVEAFLLERSIRETAPYESQVVLDVKIASQ